MQAHQLALAERLGLDGAVRELGPVSEADLAALYNGADVLLFPSFYEGFGWPPLEAMASGLPVVCSRSGSLPEVVADAALTAEPEDVDGLAAQVAAVLTNPALASELRRRGLERSLHFSWPRATSEVLEVYRSALEA
jgi:glycosyltransferase involved in cell wall biosynthesis